MNVSPLSIALHNFRFRKKIYLTPTWNLRLRYFFISNYTKSRRYYTAVYGIITTFSPSFVNIDQIVQKME